MTVVYIVIALCAGRIIRWAIDRKFRALPESLGHLGSPAVFFAAAGIIVGYGSSILPLEQPYAGLIRAGLVVGFVSPRPFLGGANSLAEGRRSALATAYLLGSYILLLFAVATGFLLDHIGRVA